MRQEVSEQHAQLAAGVRGQLLEQQRQVEVLAAGLKAQLVDLQSAVKAMDAHMESKVGPGWVFG